jgi:hypothetical protein
LCLHTELAAPIGKQKSGMEGNVGFRDRGGGGSAICPVEWVKPCITRKKNSQLNERISRQKCAAIIILLKQGQLKSRNCIMGSD